eukprot:TRINITY_DN57884_c0_g1_i1.p1 TRINITY_DN57884_c0_g1~~TRINITY_DN57884_c0_g1_i1.p1  ORF type:complete len:985 (-),score=175.65 TRINITY_DN57884_c0_g1_i1:53-3007(-)
MRGSVPVSASAALSDNLTVKGGGPRNPSRWRSASPLVRRGPAAHEADEDPMLKGLQRSSIHQVLKAARASLAEPSRPYTPLDRSLFQSSGSFGGSTSTTRPSSGYSVDQIGFIRDTYGSRPESERSSRSSRTGGRCSVIAEEDQRSRRPQVAPEVLTLDARGRPLQPSPSESEQLESVHSEDGGSSESDSEELTPVVAVASRPSASSSSAAMVSPALRPPRPRPTGGYPSLQAEASMSSRAPSAGRRGDSEKSRHRASSLQKRAHAATLDVGMAPERDGEGWEATCESTIAQLQRLAQPEARLRADQAGELQAALCQRMLALVSDFGAARSSAADRLGPPLLRAILGLLDLKDTACLFKATRSALALLQDPVATKGLTSSGIQAAYLNIARVLFKCSKVEGHDKEFLKEDLFVPLLQMLQSAAPECASSDLRVYVVGILKNVSIDVGNQKVLVKLEAVEALFGMCRSEYLTGSTSEASLLIQVTATLRNLVEHGVQRFLAEERLATFTAILALFPSNVELLTNVSRVLSKLTVHKDAQDMYAKRAHYVHVQQLVDTLATCSVEASQLVLRLAFVLGNLTADAGDDLRALVLATNKSPECPWLAEALRMHWERAREASRKDVAASSRQPHDGAIHVTKAKHLEEVMVQLVRLVANVAISGDDGRELACSEGIVGCLLEILREKRMASSEELVLNAVAAITNLLFHDVPDNLLLMEDSKRSVCQAFRPLMLEAENVEALIEAARALGNLSRQQDARRCIADERLDEVLVLKLDSDDRDLVFYVCGALVNLSADRESRERLLKVCPLMLRKISALLSDVWDDQDEELMMVVVQVLTNLFAAEAAIWPAPVVEVIHEVLQDVIKAKAPAEPDSDDTELLQLATYLVSQLSTVAGEHTGRPSMKAVSSKQAASLAEWSKPSKMIPEKPDRHAETGTHQAVATRPDPLVQKRVGTGNLRCLAPGCGRRFESQEKLAAHVARRHADCLELT